MKNEVNGMKKWMVRGWIVPLGLFAAALAAEFIMDMIYLYVYPQTQVSIAQSVGSVTMGFKPEPWFFMLSGGLWAVIGIASLCQRIAVLRRRERYEVERAAEIGVIAFGIVFDLAVIAATGLMTLAYAARL